MKERKKKQRADADSAECMHAASANEAAGLMIRPARDGFEAEAAEELFPLEAPLTGEAQPAKDPSPDGSGKKRGTVHPLGDEPLPSTHTLEDTEFGIPGARERAGFFSEMGHLDPADSFVPLE